MHRIAVWVLIAVLACLLWSPRPPAGATAAATPLSTPTAPLKCTVAPRPVDELVALWFDPAGAPRATPTPPPPIPSTQALPEGKPADAATVAGLAATMTEIDVCLATNQYARAFALYTDDLLRQAGPDRTNPDQTTAAQVRAILTAQLAATPSANMDQPLVLQIPTPRAARVLPDGRVGAVIVDPSGAYFGLFVHRGDRWLLDDAIPVLVGDATPTS